MASTDPGRARQRERPDRTLPVAARRRSGPARRAGAWCRGADPPAAAAPAEHEEHRVVVVLPAVTVEAPAPLEPDQVAVGRQHVGEAGSSSHERAVEALDRHAGEAIGEQVRGPARTTRPPTAAIQRLRSPGCGCRGPSGLVVVPRVRRRSGAGRSVELQAAEPDQSLPTTRRPASSACAARTRRTCAGAPPAAGRGRANRTVRRTDPASGLEAAYVGGGRDQGGKRQQTHRLPGSSSQPAKTGASGIVKSPIRAAAGRQRGHATRSRSPAVSAASSPRRSARSSGRSSKASRSASASRSATSDAESVAPP